jgi:hypothetical protein
MLTTRSDSLGGDSPAYCHFKVAYNPQAQINNPSLHRQAAENDENHFHAKTVILKNVTTAAKVVLQ